MRKGEFEILLTGAGGFLGRRVAEELEEAGLSYIPLVRRGGLFRKEIVGDISTPGGWQECVRRVPFTHVFHLAGCSRSVEREAYYKANVRGTENLLASLQHGTLRWFLVASSGAVYGRPPYEFVTLDEETPLRPAGDYALSKTEEEEVARRFLMQSGSVKLCVVRLSNLIGPGLSPDFFLGSIISQIRTLRSTCSHGRRVVETGCLEQTRDFIDVRDAAEAMRALMKISAEGLYNIGTGVECRLRDAVNLALELEADERIEVCETNLHLNGVIKRQALSIRKIQADTGWRPRRSLQESLKSMLASDEDVSGIRRELDK